MNTTASSRSGNSAGAREVRTNATTIPSASTTTSTMQNSFTSSQKPDSTVGNDRLKSGHEKNVCLTASHPGLVTTMAISPPITTSVDAAAMAAPRRPRRRRAAALTARRLATTSVTSTAAQARPRPDPSTSS